ncbi:hypothetical protein KC318_g2542 [Hortaea werneckii]|uniref:Uncharacterized protein n=1 Tax=Hortaea werneckii TaxID=91943 RepID=A0A3M6ZQ23_HORWE|nr:hypothetical protein KC334_g5318 [Hortaea werneckii]KAI7010708.1 hypothetical protein KC355_g6056 [Hortaea werneckii]KAI7672920.1 hypothetical protein KC318_g2542 [Hortaea werneckii]RMY17374.1 hypothetical protein D0867_06070 [Hortaea werneckii]RMY29820.1 hypothetical protein D0866_08427 [Hortaea werneckii]
MPDNISARQAAPTAESEDENDQSQDEGSDVPQNSSATSPEQSTMDTGTLGNNNPTSEAVPNNDPQTTATVSATPVSGSSTTVNVDQQTLSATPSNTNQAHNRGVSTGALAGGIIGSALAAALITGLVTFWCMRKANNRSFRTSSRRNDRHRRLYKDDKHAGLGGGRARRMELTPDANMSRASWEQFLPQSLDDHTIQNSVKVLFDQIRLHVENFYFHPQEPIKISPEGHERLSELQTPHLPGPLVDYLKSPRSVLPVIKHCLAYQVVQGMTAGQQPRLLPLGFTYACGDRGFSDSIGRKAIDRTQALRQSAAFLARNIEMDVDAFTDAFAKWRNESQDVTGAKSHLEGLLKNALSVATTLFSQPSMYQFSWIYTPQYNRSVLVVPTFRKVTDEQGKALEQPQELMRPVTERI